jgi:hypothetical protein
MSLISKSARVLANHSQESGKGRSSRGKSFLTLLLYRLCRADFSPPFFIFSASI